MTTKIYPLELAEQAEILQFESGDELIVQGGADNDIYFILAGRLSIVVNGREVAIREPGQHVGEMALIDPSATRSASLSLSNTRLSRKFLKHLSDH